MKKGKDDDESGSWNMKYYPCTVAVKKQQAAHLHNNGSSPYCQVQPKEGHAAQKLNWNSSRSWKYPANIHPNVGPSEEHIWVIGFIVSLPNPRMVVKYLSYMGELRNAHSEGLFFQFFDIENLPNFSNKIARLVVFTLETQFVPSCS